MIALVSTTQKLEIDLGGAVSANEAKINVYFFDENKEANETKWSSQQSTSTGTSDATICAAPQQSFVRCVETINVYNRDTASIDCTIKLDDGGTEYELVRQSIPTLRTLAYEHGKGWYIV